MRKVTIDFLNKRKVDIWKGAVWLAEKERAEFFSELADWAYEQLESIGEESCDEDDS